MKHREIALRDAPRGREAWSRPVIVMVLWILVERLLVTSSLQISSRIRIVALRAFGARIGARVVFRPRTRVKFPWNLEVGDDCWIGEGVWFHNQDKVIVGSNVCISQETFITTGSHDWKRDMGLVTKGIQIEDYVWVAARCNILMGSVIGRDSIVGAGTTFKGALPPRCLVASDGSIRMIE